MIITATAVAAPGSERGSTRHAAAAAAACVRTAGITADDVDVLINTGIYRDANTVAPAVAALVQREIGMHLRPERDRARPAALSFDLANGACGPLNAVQVASALLHTRATYALVVSGDAHPSCRAPFTPPQPRFPYLTAGAAMLLERVDDPEVGFGPLSTATGEPDSPPIVRGYLDVSRMGRAGRHTVTVEQDPDHLPHLLDLVSRTATSYAESHGIDLDRTLVVTGHPTPLFGRRVASRLGIPATAAATATGLGGDPHTSALTIAYHHHADRVQRDGFRHVLFVTAGAGPSAACVGYRPPRSAR
ncbi:hypothetical protein AB0A74_01240 [Saccharothrix sp. NPDC042600]|uniref:hypothetical protein n=1 Tax=Saccharothrix TaxID=2071 RepID=UPI0033E43E3B